MIFGGLQKGDMSENTQLLIYNTESHSFIGMQSYLKFTDYFQIPPYLLKRPRQEDEQEEAKVAEEQGEEDIDGTMYSWSIYGNLHAMDMKTFQWSVVEEGLASDQI